MSTLSLGCLRLFAVLFGVVLSCAPFPLFLTVFVSSSGFPASFVTFGPKVDAAAPDGFSAVTWMLSETGCAQRSK